jgi:hypothetical protein
MLIAAAVGPRLSTVMSVRRIVRIGIGLLLVASGILLATIQPELRGLGFATSMAVLGVGLGLIASQLGNVIQSSVGASARSEAGGLQYTAQQFGSALGVALIGAIVISGLSSTFLKQVSADDRLAVDTKEEVAIQLEGGLSFVASSQIEVAAQEAGLSADETVALVTDYEAAQITALKVGVLATAAIAAASFLVTTNLPSRRDDEPEELAPASGPA